jgi:hypothetical protein
VRGSWIVDLVAIALLVRGGTVFERRPDSPPRPPPSLRRDTLRRLCRSIKLLRGEHTRMRMNLVSKTGFVSTVPAARCGDHAQAFPEHLESARSLRRAAPLLSRIATLWCGLHDSGPAYFLSH